MSSIRRSLNGSLSVPVLTALLSMVAMQLLLVVDPGQVGRGEGMAVAGELQRGDAVDVMDPGGHVQPAIGSSTANGRQMFTPPSASMTLTKPRKLTSM